MDERGVGILFGGSHALIGLPARVHAKTDIAVGVLGAVLIAAGAQLTIPLGPIPITLQTFAVVVVALVGGVRGGLVATSLYLVAILVGLPVLSGGSSAPGLALIELKSVGYVVGFIPAAALCGWFGRKRALLRMALAAIAAHGVVLLCGVPVLALWVGLSGAVQHGLLPVLPGALVKGVAAAVIVALARRISFRWR